MRVINERHHKAVETTTVTFGELLPGTIFKFPTGCLEKCQHGDLKAVTTWVYLKIAQPSYAVRLEIIDGTPALSPADNAVCIEDGLGKTVLFSQGVLVRPLPCAALYLEG